LRFHLSRIHSLVHLPFRITNYRLLLAIVFRAWGLVCVNLLFAPREIRRVCSCATIRCADGRPPFTIPRFRCRLWTTFLEELFVPAIVETSISTCNDNLPHKQPLRWATVQCSHRLLGKNH